MRGLIITATTLALALCGCEYHDHATELVAERPCYLLTRGHSVSPRVQALQPDLGAVDGITVRWRISPVTLAAVPAESTTGDVRDSGFATNGVAATTVTLAVDTMVSLPLTATLTASAASDDTILTVPIELRLSTDGHDNACPDDNAVDGGIDAPPAS